MENSTGSIREVFEHSRRTVHRFDGLDVKILFWLVHNRNSGNNFRQLRSGTCPHPYRKKWTDRHNRWLRLDFCPTVGRSDGLVSCERGREDHHGPRASGKVLNQSSKPAPSVPNTRASGPLVRCKRPPSSRERGYCVNMRVGSPELTRSELVHIQNAEDARLRCPSDETLVCVSCVCVDMQRVS